MYIIKQLRMCCAKYTCVPSRHDDAVRQGLTIIRQGELEICAGGHLFILNPLASFALRVRICQISF